MYIHTYTYIIIYILHIMYTLYIYIYYIYRPLYTDSRSIQGPILSSPTRHANCPVLAFGKLNEGGISCAWVQEVFTRFHPKQERCFGWLQYLNILDIYLIYLDIEDRDVTRSYQIMALDAI